MNIPFPDPRGPPARALRLGLAVVALAGALAACTRAPVSPVGVASGPGGGEAAAGAAVSSREPGGRGAAPRPGAFPPDTLYPLLVAEFAVRRGEPGLAVETYLQVARATRDPGVAARATRIAVYARDEAAGLEASELWTRVAPDDLEAHRVRAALLVRAGRFDAAVGALRRIVEKWDDDSGRAWASAAEVLLPERDKARAVQIMRTLAGEAPEDPWAQAALARVVARAGDVDEAIAILRRAHALDPDLDHTALFLATLLRSQGRTEEALDVVAGQVERHPEESDSRMVYARFLIDAKRYEEAQAQFERLAETDPDNAEVRYALGLLLVQTNHLDAAEAQFAKLIELGERRQQAHLYLGQIAESRGDHAAAIAHYRRVDRGDNYVNAQIRVAAIYADKGELDRARQHLGGIRRRSVRDELRVYRAEAELLAEAERMEEALGVYDAALEAHPRNTDLLYARAMLAARVERFDILERDLRDILSREPDNADALNALGYTLADQTERYDEAYDLIKRALELKPNDHYVIDSMGWVLYRMGRLDEAVGHLQQAMELKADPEVAAHLGEVLWVLGRKHEAREVWDAALKATPNDKRLLDTINRFRP